MEKYYSNEIVFRGHPDFVCDQISAALLRAYVDGDRNTRAGIEVMGGKGKIFITGEVTSNANVDVEKVTKRVLKDIGYSTDYEIINNLGKQSGDIALGTNDDVGGAGDQGMMFGYACDDTKELLPTAMVILQKLSKEYDELRKKDNRFLPDGKAQITGVYNDDFKLQYIKDFTISYQNTEEEREETDKILKDIATRISQEYGIEIRTFHINPTGKFFIGGFEGDAGLTGRKIVVDAYQSFANVGGGCVDCDTEYMTPNGWKLIKDYNNDDMVAQWNNGKLEFVKPINYIKDKVDSFYYFRTPSTLDMVLSKKHNVLYRTSKKNFTKKTVENILFEYNTKSSGCRIEIPLWFESDFQKGINLTENEIKIQLAFCADGTILNNSKWGGRIRVKKQHKKEELRNLLANYTYKESIDGEYSIFWLNPPIKSKSLVYCFKDINKSQALIIYDNIFKWDGDIKRKIFRTTIKEDADFIQYLLMGCTGKSVSISTEDRIGKPYKNYTRKSKLYTVKIKDLKYSNAFRKSIKRCSNLTINNYNSKDGFMYCINVPSHNLILRRNDKVFITGNCMNGKDSSKVDFSAAHKARQLAKRFLLEKGLKWCEVQLSYAIGIAEPLAIYVDSDKGNIEVSDELYKECTPKRIIDDLKLKDVDYEELAKFGHFRD